MRFAFFDEFPDSMVRLTVIFSLTKKYQNYDNPLIGCFSAASNVTGILTDVDNVAACLHRNGALAFFDYATAGTHFVHKNINGTEAQYR